jgi:translation initiation factor IF-3
MEVLSISGTTTELMVNEEIRDKEVRLVDSDGSMLGIMSSKDAQKLANNKNLDLVKISPKADPPVCKIMDYGKHMFELAKKEKEAKKNQKVINIKEVWLSPTIETHDFEFKAKNAGKFLTDGFKLKVSMKLRGRQMSHTSIGMAVMKRFAEVLKELGTLEKEPRLEGRNIIMFMNSKK